ncbi:MAG TPA: DPP IV N-terminal domain-containing protein [Vicinamibacteria bacterium]|nr:DPP IV N-terminal domain-containing protein [Vicinamibacteria bacterium]
MLLEGGSDARYVSSGHLVYALEDGLFAVAFDPAALRVTSGPVSMVQGVLRAGEAASANYAVSGSGTLFFLTGEEATSNPLAWVDRDGGAEVIEAIPPKEYLWPRLSPDGGRVVVVAKGDLWIFELASGRESRLTTDGVNDYPGCTPSGDAVTYTSGSGSAAGEIWIRPPDGSGEARQLTSLGGGRVDFYAWAPDGRTFSAHYHVRGDRRSATKQLMAAFDGENAVPEIWLDDDHRDHNAVFSPNGNYVAYLSSQTGQYEVYIRPFPGPGGQTPVSVGGGNEPVWAPSGEIFYRRLRDYTMMAVAVQTAPKLTVGAPVELFPGRPPRGASPSPRYSVTGDGQRFLMTADALASVDVNPDSGHRFIVVQNWVEELKARVPN